MGFVWEERRTCQNRRMRTKSIHAISKQATPRAPGMQESRCEVTYRAQLFGVTTVFEPRLTLEGIRILYELNRPSKR